jgi:hypothetical protein
MIKDIDLFSTLKECGCICILSFDMMSAEFEILTKFFAVEVLSKSLRSSKIRKSDEVCSSKILYRCNFFFDAELFVHLRASVRTKLTDCKLQDRGEGNVLRSPFWGGSVSYRKC